MRILFILLSLISVIACENKFTPPKGFIELKDHKPRTSTLGVSFLPPSGEKWYEGYSEKTIMYLKQTDPSKLSIFAGATEAEIKENISSEINFLNYVKTKKDDFSKDPNRYKNNVSSFNINSSIAPYCVSYKQTVEDHKANNLNNNKYLVLTNKGLICLHPVKNKHVIDIYYSSRAIPSLELLELTKELDAFINSLKFEEGVNNA